MIGYEMLLWHRAQDVYLSFSLRADHQIPRSDPEKQRMDHENMAGQ